MTYRDADLDRRYICPGCGSPERAWLRGGEVACTRCGARHVLPDRSSLPADPLWRLPPQDPARAERLRAQDGRPRQVPLTLQAALGGTTIQSGREQEALAIWQSLRKRAQEGDVAASEHLSALTSTLRQSPAMAAQPELVDALLESAFDAAVLPRHKQEQLGELVRAAAARGDRARAHRYLGSMVPDALDLEMDSDARISAAVLATVEGDGPRVLQVLGPHRDALPIADSFDALASVFRANAYEMLGDVEDATRALRQLPRAHLLELVREQFPALRLCARSGEVYTAEVTQKAAQRAAADARRDGAVLGPVFGLAGGLVLVVGIVSGTSALLAFGAVFLVYGVVWILKGVALGKRAAWLRTYGTPLTARIVGAEKTREGATNRVPEYTFLVEVTGASGTYQASFDRIVPEHAVPSLLGSEIRVRANPNNLGEIIPEEWC